MEKQPENKMGRQQIGPLMLKMSLPIMVSMLVQALYNIVDSIFVARLSESAFTAVSLVFPYQMLVISVAVGTGVGVNALAARRLGEKKQAEANAAAAHGQFLALVSGLAFSAVFALFTPVLIRLFKPDAEIYAHACTYLSWVGVPSVFVVLQCMNEKILQATGDTFHSMLSQLVGAVFNIIFDPILIFGLFGFPKLGVAGAALATAAGQALGMGLGFYYLHKKNSLIDISMKGFRPDRAVTREIYRVGLPSIVMRSITSLTSFGMNQILMGLTPTAVSVMGAYSKLESFVFMPVFGLSSGAMPIISYNYGAQSRERVLSALKYSCLYAGLILCGGMVLFLLFAKEFLLLFNASEHMLAIGVPALRIISLGFPAAALGIMFSTFFQSIGNGRLSLLVSACRQLVIILPVAYFLSNIFGVTAAWVAYPIAECIALCISALFLRRVIQTCIEPLA